MNEIKFGGEMRIVSLKTTDYSYSYGDGVSPEIRISEVNRAIDCWKINGESISFVFPPYASPDSVDRVFHPVFSRYGFDWIKGLNISHVADIDAFAESIASYFKNILQENKANQSQ